MRADLLRKLYFYKACGYRYVSESFLRAPSPGDDLPTLAHTIGTCRLCNNAKTCRHTMNLSGELSLPAAKRVEILVVFERPNEAQDTAGAVFVGATHEWFASELATKCAGAGVGATFVVRCAGTHALAYEQCAPYLFDEIFLVRPRIIATMGDTASQFVLKSPNLPPIEAMHGSVFHEHGTFVVPMYDLDFIRKNPSKKPEMEADIAKIASLL